MSNSATAPTSTTASSPSSTSSGGAGEGARGIEIIACGALAAHIREIAHRRGWPITVRPLPASLHNRPERIAPLAESAIARASKPSALPVLAYADCGTYGALDNLSQQTGAPRLPGLHCYDLYAGEAQITKLFDEEPGSYLLTDYLVRTFDRTVIASLGLDRHPELWPDYFRHYKRLIWLAQNPTPKLEGEAERIASRFGLPLTRVSTGLSGLESALASLLHET